MGAIKDLLEAVGTAATNSVLRERLALLVDEAERLEKENERLQTRVSDLEEQAAQALQQLHATRKTDEYVEQDGALFKRDARGGYVKAVYCPRCKVSAGSVGDGVPFFCQPCNWFSSFGSSQLGAVMSRLPS